MNKEIFRNELIELGYEKISPLKAIKQFCFECCGESTAEVKRCTGKTCSLYPFRFGKNPFSQRNSNMTEERRKAAAERFKKYRENKGENNYVEDE